MLKSEAARCALSIGFIISSDVMVVSVPSSKPGYPGEGMSVPSSHRRAWEKQPAARLVCLEAWLAFPRHFIRSKSGLGLLRPCREALGWMGLPGAARAVCGLRLCLQKDVQAPTAVGQLFVVARVTGLSATASVW